MGKRGVQRGCPNTVLKGCTCILPTFTYTWSHRNHHDHQDTVHKGGIHPNITLADWKLDTNQQRKAAVDTNRDEVSQKTAGKTRMDQIRNEEIRRRVHMQPAEQTAYKNKIRWWWSHVKRMAPTVPQSKSLVIQPEGRRPRGRPRNRWGMMYRDGSRRR